MPSFFSLLIKIKPAIIIIILGDFCQSTCLTRRSKNPKWLIIKDIELIEAMADKALSRIVKVEDKTSTPVNQLNTAADALIKAIAEHQ